MGEKGIEQGGRKKRGDDNKIISVDKGTATQIAHPQFT